MSKYVSLLQASDEVGAVSWQLPKEVSEALQRIPGPQRERLQATIEHLLFTWTRIIGSEVQYCLRHGTEHIEGLANVMAEVSHFQQERLGNEVLASLKVEKLH